MIALARLEIMLQITDGVLQGQSYICLIARLINNRQKRGEILRAVIDIQSRIGKRVDLAWPTARGFEAAEQLRQIMQLRLGKWLIE